MIVFPNHAFFRQPSHHQFLKSKSYNHHRMIDMQPSLFQTIFSNLFANFVIGIINLIYTISFSALVFNCVLAEYIQLGISVILVS